MCNPFCLFWYIWHFNYSSTTTHIHNQWNLQANEKYDDKYRLAKSIGSGSMLPSWVISMWSLEQQRSSPKTMTKSIRTADCRVTRGEKKRGEAKDDGVVSRPGSWWRAAAWRRSCEASWPAARDPRELLLGSIQSQVHVHVRIIKGSLVLSCACKWKRNLKMNEMEKIVRETSCQRFGWWFCEAHL